MKLDKDELDKNRMIEEILEIVKELKNRVNEIDYKVDVIRSFV